MTKKLQQYSDDKARLMEENKLLTSENTKWKNRYEMEQVIQYFPSTQDVRTTLYGRCSDVKTLKRRPYNVVLTFAFCYSGFPRLFLTFTHCYAHRILHSCKAVQ